MIYRSAPFSVTLATPNPDFIGLHVIIRRLISRILFFMLLLKTTSPSSVRWRGVTFGCRIYWLVLVMNCKRKCGTFCFRATEIKSKRFVDRFNFYKLARHLFMPPQPMLQRRHYVVAMSCRGFCAVPNICLVSQQYGTDFDEIRGHNHYHEQIKWLHFGRNWNRDTTEYSNRRQSVLPRRQRGADA